LHAGRERLHIGSAILPVIDRLEMPQRVPDFAIIVARDGLIDREQAPIERLGFGMAVLDEIEIGQIVEVSATLGWSGANCCSASASARREIGIASANLPARDNWLACRLRASMSSPAPLGCCAGSDVAMQLTSKTAAAIVDAIVRQGRPVMIHRCERARCVVSVSCGGPRLRHISDGSHIGMVPP
jgi:hypothetical protein